MSKNLFEELIKTGTTVRNVAQKSAIKAVNSNSEESGGSSNNSSSQNKKNNAVISKTLSDTGKAIRNVSSNIASYAERKKNGNVFVPSTVLSPAGFKAGSIVKSAVNSLTKNVFGIPPAEVKSTPQIENPLFPDADKAAKLKFIPEASDSLNDGLMSLYLDYRWLYEDFKDGKISASDYSNGIDNLKTEHKKTYDDYFKETNGKTLEIPKLGDMFKTAYKDYNYYEKVQSYYNNYYADDFKQYSEMNTGKKNKIEDFLSSVNFSPSEDDTAKILSDVEGNGDAPPAYYNPNTGEVQILKVSGRMKKGEEKYLYMTEEERKIYNYLLNKHGDKTADDFLEKIEMYLDKRRTQGISLYEKNLANEHKIVGTMNYVGNSLLSGIAYGDAAGQTIKQMTSSDNSYKPYNPYTKAATFVHQKNADKEGIQQDMSGFGKFATDIGLSVGENAARVLLGPMALPVMGASVAGQTAVDRGLKGETSAGKALATGTAYGAIEIATEKMPLDNILKVMKAPPSTVKEAVITLLKNTGVEAGEEVIANVADNIADSVINGDKSDYEQYKIQLMKQGVSEGEAERKAFTKFYLEDTGISALQGGLAGGIMNIGSMAGGAAVNNYNDTVQTGREFKNMDEVQSVIDTGKDSAAATAAYKYAQNLQQKQAAGKGLSDWNIGRQYQKNVKAIQSENEFAAAMSNIKPTEITDRLYSDTGRELNGMAMNEGVKISSNGSQSIPTTIKHEWSHMFKMLYPEAYQEYENCVIEAAREANNEAVNKRMDFHMKENGYSEVVAREEIVAELTGGFNTNAIQQMAEGNNSLAEKIAAAARRAKRTIRSNFTDDKYTSNTGLQITFEQLNNTEKMYVDGLAKARDNAAKSGDVRYEIKQNSKGKYVQADRQVIKSDNPADWEKEIYNYINDDIRKGHDVVIPTDDGDELTLTEKTSWKMGYRNEVDSGNGKQQISKDLYRTKINAAAHIDELAEISKRGKKNAPDTKNHGFAQVGFNYRTAYFRDLDGQYYKLTISVGENSEQKTVYNIGKIERVPFPDINAQRQSGNKTASAKKNSFNNSISENGDNVKYSVKENTANRITTDIIKENGSTIKKNEIVDDVRAVYELLANGEVTDKKYRAAWDIAENIGQRVAQGIQITDSEMYDNYKDLRNTLRNTPISISDADRADITDVDSFNEFRRKNFGSLRITNDGTRIDQFYQELSELYPNFFDAEKETHPADQLMQIEKVLQDMKPKTHGLSDAEIGEAAGDIASKLITDIINNTSVKMSDSEYDDWDSLMTGEEAKRQEKLQERSREKEFAEGLLKGRQGRQGVFDELRQDIRQDVNNLIESGSVIDRYNAESASRVDRKQFTKSDIIPAIKNYGVGFMKREIDKLYPIKAYERYAQNQIHSKEKIQFRGKESPYVMSSNSIDAESRAKYILTEKLTDFDANEIGESLADIVGELGYDDYRDFNTYLKLKHGLEWIDFKNNDYKPVFNNKILNSYEAMQAGINELEAKHSDFMGLAKRVYDYQGKLMQAWLVDTGIITQKQFDILREKYPCYVPFFRQDDTPTSHFRPKKGIANQSNPIMQAEGGGQKIYDPIENIMINTSRFVNAAAKNSAMQAVVNIYDKVPGMEHYMAEVVKNAEGKYVLKDKNHQASDEADTDTVTEEHISDMVQHAIKLTDGDIVTVLENGNKRYFKVFDKHFLDALDNMRPIQSGAVMRAVASATRVFSALATSNNPVFTLASNPIKDTQNAFMQTTQKNPFAVVTSILDAQVEQFKNSDIGKKIGQKSNADYDGTDAYKKYMAMGGEYASAFSAGRSAMKEALRDVKPGKGGVKSKAANAVKFVPRLYGNMADAIETGPRLGEFKYSNGKAGNDVHQAHFDSKNVTLNFGRSGTVGEKINKFVPFYNPSVQGISTMVQKFKDKPFQTSMRVGVGIAVSVLLSALNKRDEESEEAYENASSYLKNNYYLLHIKDGKFIKIPKSQEYGLAASFVERVIEKYAYDNPDAFYNYADYLSTALLPSLLQAEFPFVDTGSVIGLGTYTSLLENKDFKGSPIVPDYLQDEAPEMQYDDRTSYIARWIGKELKWSPKKIDYVIKSNTGFLGKINESVGHSGEKDWSMGVSTKFTADSLFSTDKTNMFYENKDEADRQANSYPSADNEYLSNRFEQSGKMMSILNALYKENRNTGAEREIRKAYVDYAKNNKDNPAGYSDEVYSELKKLFDIDNKVLSVPSVSREIKMKIDKEDRSFIFTDSESLLNYQKDLNRGVDEAYRELFSSVEYGAMSDIEKAAAISDTKGEAVKNVKRFYIENEGSKRMYDDETTAITKPKEADIKEYTQKQEYKTQIEEKLQSVSDGVAKIAPDKADSYGVKSFQINDIKSVKIDGKSYDIPSEIESKIISAANDEHYSNIEKLLNNEINVEDIVGYTSKGKASTAKQADGTTVSLTGKLYNEDGSPRFDELVIAKIISKSKEKSKENASGKFRSEITGENTEGIQVSKSNVSGQSSSTSVKSSYGKSSSGSKRSGSGGRVKFTSAKSVSGGGKVNNSKSGSVSVATQRNAKSNVSLPGTINPQLIQTALNSFMKNNKVDTIKPLENPLFM